MKVAVALIILCVIELLIFRQILSFTWGQVGTVYLMSLAAGFLGNVIAPRRCTNCGGTDWKRG